MFIGAYEKQILFPTMQKQLHRNFRKLHKNLFTTVLEGIEKVVDKFIVVDGVKVSHIIIGRT